jgi:hypothetical protein
MPTYNPTLGGDPEFFVYIKDGDKLIVQTADKFLPPKALPGNAMYGGSSSGTYHFDGVQAEVNPKPYQCRHNVAQATHVCMKSVYELAKKKYPGKEVYILPLASITVTPEDIKDTDMECRRFGCSPDINIYDDPKVKYPDGNVFMTRFSGGHIHFGFDQLVYAEKFKQPGKLMSLLKVLDIIPGIISVAASPGEEEKIRREWYGKAGCYRIQKHGIEYRTLSSFWIVSPQLLSMMFGFGRDAFLTVFLDQEEKLFKAVGDMNEVKRIINEVDADAARKMFFNVIKPFYLKHLVHRRPEKNPDNFSCLIENSPYKYDSTKDVIDKIVTEGYKTYFNPLDTVKYWRLNHQTINFPSGFGIYTFGSEVKVRGDKGAITVVKGEGR